MTSSRKTAGILLFSLLLFGLTGCGAPASSEILQNNLPLSEAVQQEKATIQAINPKTPEGQEAINAQVDQKLQNLDASLSELDKTLDELDSI